MVQDVRLDFPQVELGDSARSHVGVSNIGVCQFETIPIGWPLQRLTTWKRTSTSFLHQHLARSAVVTTTSWVSSRNDMLLLLPLFVDTGVVFVIAHGWPRQFT